MKIKTIQEQPVSKYLFWLYIYFVIGFFVHLSARIPGYGVIRPTLLLVIFISIPLILKKDKPSEIINSPVFKKIKWLIIYIFITLPLVTWPGSVVFNNLPVFTKAIVFFFFTAFIIDTEKRLKIFLFVYIACQTFRVLEPLYMHFTSGYWGSSTYLGGGDFAERLSGSPSDIVNPNGLGFVLVTTIPFWYYLAWQSSYKSLKLLFLIILPILLYALVLTMSRGAFIALMVVFWMVFKESKHKLFFMLLVITVLIGTWFNLSPDHKDRYLSLVSTHARESASAEGRWRGMVNEFGVGLERPIVGHGLGTSQEAKTHAGVGWMISHNLYIEILIELGSLGLILFFLFLKEIYTKFKQNMDKMLLYHSGNKMSFPWRLNTALKAVFWMYAVYSFNYFGLSVYYWYLFAGFVVAFSRIYFSERNENSKDMLNCE